MIELFQRARGRSEPILAIGTPDPAATMREIAKVTGDAPRISWNVINGLRPLNKPAGEMSLGWAFGASGQNPKMAQAASVQPATALDICLHLKETSIVFFQGIDAFLKEPPTKQAIWNCRDQFKKDQRTLVLLGPSFAGMLPPSIANDIIVIDEALPDEHALEEILESQVKAIRESHATVKPLRKDQTEKAVAALKGLAAYPAEQAVAMSLDKTGLDLELLWHWKKQIVETTPGLLFDTEKFTFDDIGGLDRAKQFGRLMFDGNDSPSLVIRIEEIEKAFAGSGGDSGGGDSSGVTQDQLGVILTAMEDNGWSGMIAAGPPGCAKSFYSKALANTFGVPSLSQDIGAAKSKWVGESQQMIRQQLKVIKAIAGNRAFFVATSNNVENLPAALLRRFKAGIWVFELPDETEKKQIWDIQCKAYGVGGERPRDTGFCGADIRNVCEQAHKLKVSLTEAATYTICVSESKPEVIETFRAHATRRYLSASHPGRYVRPDQITAEPEAVAVGGRRFH
jgi:hypothetical protein